MSKFSSYKVGPDKKRKRDVIVSGQTAAAKVVLWEQHVDSLQEGKSYSLKNFHVEEFKSKKYLSMLKSDFKITAIHDLQDTIIQFLLTMNTLLSIMSV